MPLRSPTALIALTLLLGSACERPENIVMAQQGHGEQHCAAPLDFVVPDRSDALLDCSESTDTGYDDGTPFEITVVTADDKPVEVATANAYWVMKEAAALDGVNLWIVSGFRTYASQEYLYGCYVNCNCNNCNLAAYPGYSNHQSGHALDLNTSSAGVYNWLANNAEYFGFYRTVPSEDWHWEWWSGGPGGGPCGQDPECADPNFGSCEGDIITRCEGGQVATGDCAYYGGTCSTAGGAAHCVHPYCVADENGNGCLDETQIYDCDLGAFNLGDCGYFGLNCSTEGEMAHCIQSECQGNENGVFGCTEDGQLNGCNNGIIEAQTCGFLNVCHDEGEARHGRAG